MNIHEYQAKELLAGFGVAIPRGGVAYSPEQAVYRASEIGGARWAVKDDPRRLRIGALMREWNIDETPQFWNVLKGEMSLVGPRPERPELIASFKHQIPHYNDRHASKPGLTG